MNVMRKIIATRIYSTARMVCFLALAISLPWTSFSQTENEGGEEPVEEKATARMSLEYFKIDNAVKLLVTVKSKVEDTYQNISGVEVNFYKGEIGEVTLLGKDTTNAKGIATFVLPSSPNQDTSGVLYLATIENNAQYGDAEEEITVKDLVLEMKLEAEDSSRWARIFIGIPIPGGDTMPVAEVECKLFVKRMFGLLPLSETPETTDEEGMINFEMPVDIPGDKDGNITIVAKIEGSEAYGNIEVNKAMPWGVPLKAGHFSEDRELWSARSNAPLSLIFIVNAVLIGIWGVIAYIFIKIIKINRLGKVA